MRSGDVAKAGSTGKQADSGTRRVYLSVFASAKDKREIAELAVLASRGDDPGELELQRLRERLGESVGRTLREFGLEGPTLALRTESLASQIEVLLMEQRKTVDEVEEMVRQGIIQP